MIQIISTIIQGIAIIILALALINHVSSGHEKGSAKNTVKSQEKIR